MVPADPLRRARSKYEEARAAIGQYRLPDARRLLAEARGLIPQSAAESAAGFELSLRLDLTGTWITSDEDGLPAALDELAAARGRAVAAGRDDLRALAHIQAGVLAARAGHVDDALQHLRPAVEFAGELELDDRLRLLLNKGTIASQAGKLAEAARDLAEAASLARDMPEYAFMALHNLGFVEYLRGDLPAALRAMLAADEMDAPVDRSVARLDHARVMMEVGLVDDAARLLAGTVDDLRSAGMTDELVAALLDRARCELLRGRTADAVAIADEVVAATASREGDRRGIAAGLVRLEALVAGGDDGSAHVEAAGRLVAEADAAGLEHLADRAAALGVLAARGDVVGWADLGSRLRRMRRSPYLATRLLGIQAELLCAADDARRGRLLRTAVEELSRAKAGMASLDLRTALTTHVSPIIVLDLERAVATTRPWSVLEATERWRAALRTVPSVRPPADEGAAGLWSRLRQRHEELRDQAAADPVLTAEVAALERQLREHSWTAPGTLGRPVTTRLRRDVAGDRVLLSYFWTRDGLHLVEVTPGRAAQLHRLGDGAEVRELVARAGSDASALARAPRGPLAGVILSSLEATLDLLDEALLPPGLPGLPVVVVPSGALSRLPWGMLPRLRRRSLTLSQSVAQFDWGRTVVAGPPAVAVAAGPGLALAEDEAAHVVGSWPRAKLLDGGPRAVREALATHEVVHIAAHGTHRADNPLFSSLLLHGGALFAHELETVALRSSLVVLSACGAGRARLRPGDEALGLTSSLLALGVGSVVAPLTDVPDDVARDTMAGLHERLAAGEDGAQALAASGDSLLSRSFTWFGSPWHVSGTA